MSKTCLETTFIKGVYKNSKKFLEKKMEKTDDTDVTDFNFG